MVCNEARGVGHCEMCMSLNPLTCAVHCQNSALTEIFGKVAEAFKVNVVEGVLSHQTKRFVIDGNKVHCCSITMLL